MTAATPRPAPARYVIFGAALAILPPIAPASHADAFEDFGTAMKYGLPAAAALCAHRQHRLEDLAVRGILQAALVWGLKEVLSDSPIGQRPSGQGKGFPSGHAAMAFFGATDLAGKCFHDRPAPAAASYGLAGLAGYSRIHAGQHDATQVMSGALIGLGFGGASLNIGTKGASFSFGMRF